MSNEERQKLLEEQRMIKMLLDFHVTHRDKIAMDEKEFEAYLNAALDRLIEIKNLLTETSELL